MNVKYINPFIESVGELFSTMFSAKVERGDLSIGKGLGDGPEVIGMIGISGEVQGSVAVAMSVRTALNVVGAMLGSEVTTFDAVTTDGVAEVVNMIAGGAKAKLKTNGGQPLQLSLPTVLTGRDFAVTYPSQTLWLDIPFQSGFGPFNIRVTLKDASNN